MVKEGDILEMRNGRAFQVIEGYSSTGFKGDVTIVEVDEDNNHIGKPFRYELSASSPIIDIIR